ncbi:peptidoglycan-binding protein [Streptomyces sp. Ru72]|uniref:peptidoglycan-binding domain-containing protein n=1 Tax=Streptomyces sp. Ru72 TaxID=2080747 RepID=UPI000CDD6F0A|nr:peptidoglycan-binding protein [Streptomyces sp. Ru72]POX48023.1 peptidoglycan-binding protein [Streptomyces sp. Ru72]
MNGPNGQACPECAAPRRGDGTPSCGCTRRAAEALREARTAEAAAAEDFDPLRIRPYVELGTGTVRLGAVPQEPDETVRLGAVSDEADARVRSAAAPDVTTALPAVPDVEDRAEPAATGAEPRPRRLRRTVLLATGGAVVAVVAAAGYASGLFSYDPPKRDGALPQEIRAGVPEASSPAGTSAPAEAVSVAAPPPSRKPSPTASPSPSPSSPSPTPSTSPSPSGTPTTAPATATASHSPQAHPRQSAVVLRVGDKGPEVRELQLRLRQLGLYLGPSNGTYDAQVESAVRNYQIGRGITQDEPGVYGAATRARLESETTRP